MPDLTTILDTAVLVLAVPTAVALLAAIIGTACAEAKIGRYLLNLLITLDQGINTLLGGSPDETISAVAFRKGGSRFDPLRWRLAYRAVNLLFFWQQDHCRQAYETERTGGHLHSSYHE